MKGGKVDESIWNYSSEPLVPELIANHILASFMFPKFIFNGSRDLEGHLARYNNHMKIFRAFDTIMCRAFFMTPSQTARQWIYQYLRIHSLLRAIT
ncbi:hypothetical protein J1N35_002505 [Gossypium stocksii]|uniref:Uncharacterized protein n=1 Tax=Gossypium stocksii TaxID=47602 RepID=A0A9D3WJM9_9ROSI|nr:hypothetical protein J1N35_002505 [Gossypium stocksii]